MTGNEKDTDKIAGKRPDIWTLLTWAKGNPLLLAAVAIASGTGGQQVLEQLGQQVQWWQIALAIAGYAVFDLATRILKRLDTIEQRLAKGAEVMRQQKDIIDDLMVWRSAADTGARRARSTTNPRIQPIKP